MKAEQLELQSLKERINILEKKIESKLILITDDGNSIYLGNKYWTCRINEINFLNISENVCIEESGGIKDLKYFSTKENAEEYIRNNKNTELFISEDNVKIYPNQYIYCYNIESKNKDQHSFPQNLSKNITNWLVFSTSEAREEWIKNNVYPGKWKVGDIILKEQLILGVDTLNHSNDLKKCDVNWSLNRELLTIEKKKGFWVGKLSDCKSLWVILDSIPELSKITKILIGKDNNIEVEISKEKIVIQSRTVNIDNIEAIVDILKVVILELVIGKQKL